jgi:hypothetical protein
MGLSLGSVAANGAVMMLANFLLNSFLLRANFTRLISSG